MVKHEGSTPLPSAIQFKTTNMFGSSNTTRQQGDIGMTHAIFELSKLGYTISIPITDNSLYDLVVERDNKLYSVQVKSTSYTRNGKHKVQLKRSRPNRTRNIIHNFDNTEVDFLFVSVDNGDCYFIPSIDIHVKTELTLDDKYISFKLP